MTAQHRQGALDIATAVGQRAVDARAIARAVMEDIVRGESGPDRLNALASFSYEQVVESAAAVDERIAAGERLPLAGVPIVVKDNICTLGLPTTCGSRLLTGYHSPYEATAVRRLREAGAIIVGKANLDEFGMGSSTENSALGATRNPVDPQRVPGGSSGGSAAAVAAGWVPVALGSETGGSVRQPAAFCGIVGIKPSYGRVSRYGLVAYASSLDQIGVFGRRVIDAAMVLDAIAGVDSNDATSSVQAPPSLVRDAVLAGRSTDMSGLVVGVPDEYFPEGLDTGVRDACDGALDALRRLGATIRPVSLPHTRYAVPTYYVIATAEASSNLSRFDGVRFGVRPADVASTGDMYQATRSAGFGTEVKRRIMLGTYVLSAGYHDQYYGTAQRVRTLIQRDFDTVFTDGVDILYTPTTPTPAFLLGEKTADPYEMYLSDIFTVTANLAALPAMSLPIGRSGALPVGGQLLAPRWREDIMVRVGAALETELGAW